MFPEANLNLTAVTAAVVLQYPAAKHWFCAALAEWLTVAIKCFTNVVLEGLNKCKKPFKLSSLFVWVYPGDNGISLVLCAKSSFAA